MTEPWLRWAGWAHGPIFGIVLLLTAGHTVLNPENIDFPILRNLELNVAMFGALFVGFGVVLVWVRALVDARTEPVVSTDDAMFGLGIGLVGLGALFTVVLFAQFFVEDTCGCEPAPAIGGFVLLMGVATLGGWALSLGWLEQRWLIPVRVVGYVALAGSIVAGAMRLSHDVREIL